MEEKAETPRKVGLLYAVTRSGSGGGVIFFGMTRLSRSLTRLITFDGKDRHQDRGARGGCLGAENAQGNRKRRTTVWITRRKGKWN